MTRLRNDRVLFIGIAIAVVSPPLLTLILVRLPTSEARAYVFLYLGIVASLGLLTGLIPALVAAALSSVSATISFSHRSTASASPTRAMSSTWSSSLRPRALSAGSQRSGGAQ